MSAPGAHGTAGAGHAELPFRVDCPICRAERLAGAREGTPARRRRNTAFMAAVIATSGLMPVAAPPAVADEGSEAQELDRLMQQLEGIPAPAGEDEELAQEDGEPDPPTRRSRRTRRRARRLRRPPGRLRRGRTRRRRRPSRLRPPWTCPRWRPRSSARKRAARGWTTARL